MAYFLVLVSFRDHLISNVEMGCFVLVVVAAVVPKIDGFQIIDAVSPDVVVVLVFFRETNVQDAHQGHVPTVSVLSLRMLSAPFLEDHHLGILGDFFHHHVHLGSGHVGHAHQRAVGRPDQQDVLVLQRVDRTDLEVLNGFQLVYDQQIIGGDLVLGSCQFQDGKEPPRGVSGPERGQDGLFSSNRTVAVVRAIFVLVLVVIIIVFIVTLFSLAIGGSSRL
mmetsp:Transcript_29357/g.62955  ORF Transcript_29357/g.62955 Transcript_29357/m.62955 type:complete len:221 (-) Transcript_29357:503-1165(-)